MDKKGVSLTINQIILLILGIIVLIVIVIIFLNYSDVFVSRIREFLNQIFSIKPELGPVEK